MLELILFTCSALPVFLVGKYIYSKDKNKEPKKLLIKLFLGGIFATVLTIIITLLLQIFFPLLAADESKLNSAELLIYVFLGVALIEEFSKWIMLYKISYNDRAFDELYDMIIYGAFVALGFAFFENLFYVYESGIGTAFVRGLFSVPGHACDGVVMGYLLGIAKINSVRGKKGLEARYKLLSIFVPTLLHGFFDYCLMIESITFIGLFLIFVIILFAFSAKKIKRVSRMNLRFRFKNKFCPNCGTSVSSHFCPNCGNENK